MKNTEMKTNIENIELSTLSGMLSKEQLQKEVVKFLTGENFNNIYHLLLTLNNNSLNSENTEDILKVLERASDSLLSTRASFIKERSASLLQSKQFENEITILKNLKSNYDSNTYKELGTDLWKKKLFFDQKAKALSEPILKLSDTFGILTGKKEMVLTKIKENLSVPQNSDISFSKGDEIFDYIFKTFVIDGKFKNVLLSIFSGLLLTWLAWLTHENFEELNNFICSRGEEFKLLVKELWKFLKELLGINTLEPIKFENKTDLKIDLNKNNVDVAQSKLESLNENTTKKTSWALWGIAVFVTSVTIYVIITVAENMK